MNTSDDVKRLLAELTPREEHLIRFFFGIGEHYQSVAEIAARFCITERRAQQLLSQAFGKLAKKTEPMPIARKPRNVYEGA